MSDVTWAGKAVKVDRSVPVVTVYKNGNMRINKAGMDAMSVREGDAVYLEPRENGIVLRGARESDAMYEYARVLRWPSGRSDRSGLYLTARRVLEVLELGRHRLVQVGKSWVVLKGVEE